MEYDPRFFKYPTDHIMSKQTWYGRAARSYGRTYGRFYRQPKRRRISRHFVSNGSKQMMEKKDHISAIAPQNLFNNTAVQSLVLTSTGTTSITRIGNEISIKSINILIEIYAQVPLITGVLKNTARIMLVYDRQPNGVMATFADINDLNTSPFGFRNLNNRFRFKTLWDSGLVSISDQTGNKDYHHIWNLYMKCDLPVGYSNSTAVIASVSTGNLMIFAQADTGTTTLFEVQARTRLRFTDGRSAGAQALKTWGMKVVKTNI